MITTYPKPCPNNKYQIALILGFIQWNNINVIDISVTPKSTLGLFSMDTKLLFSIP